MELPLVIANNNTDIILGGNIFRSAEALESVLASSLL